MLSGSFTIAVSQTVANLLQALHTASIATGHFDWFWVEFRSICNGRFSRQGKLLNSISGFLLLLGSRCTFLHCRRGRANVWLVVVALGHNMLVVVFVAVFLCISRFCCWMVSKYLILLNISSLFFSLYPRVSATTKVVVVLRLLSWLGQCKWAMANGNGYCQKT